MRLIAAPIGFMEVRGIPFYQPFRFGMLCNLANYMNSSSCIFRNGVIYARMFSLTHITTADQSHEFDIKGLYRMSPR